MQLDAIDLKEFYTCPLGLVVRRLLGSRLRARWGELKGARIFGLGFATPYLGAFRGEASALGALMPADQGVIPWPEKGQGLSVLVDETELPLSDEQADRILIVHMLEWSENTRALLRELWRVLAPDGRLLIIVPHRRGLWARVDTTPFGYGRPFSRSQLMQLLKEAMFSPVFWERLGLVLWPAFSGVIMVEASKQVYGAVPVRESRKFRRRIMPVPAGVTPNTAVSSSCQRRA